MIITRRDFARISIQSASALALTGAFSRLGLMNAYAQAPTDYRALVCIFLFGGNDGNNMIIPIDAADATAYQQMRGPLALTSGLQTLKPTSGGRNYALHPSMSALAGLYNQDRVAIMANAGTLVRPTSRAQYQSRSVPLPANLFSHSDQQSQWQTTASNSQGTTGWAGRVADLVRPLNGSATYPSVVSVAGAPIFCNGQQTVPATVIPNSADPRVLGSLACNGETADICTARGAALQEVLTLDSGATMIQESSRVTQRAFSFGNELNAALAAAPAVNTTFPATSLAAQLRQVAYIISARNQLGLRRQIFFCSMGGFDTHSGQLADHATLLTSVDAAMAAFYQATTEMGVAGNVTSFTLSEFGRTMGMNAGSGSDHAWGSHQLVMGGAVRGGNLYGNFPILAAGGPDDSGSTGRWIPSTSLDQYAATLASWFGVADADLPAVFPNLSFFPTQKLTFMG